MVMSLEIIKIYYIQYKKSHGSIRAKDYIKNVTHVGMT